MFSEMLRDYTPLSALKRIISDVLAPLGKFAALEKTVADSEIACDRSAKLFRRRYLGQRKL